MSLENDMLKQMFERQQEFQDRLGHPRIEIPDFFDRLDTTTLANVMGRVRDSSQAIMMEGAELMDWTPWKHWSRNSGNKQVLEADLGNPQHIKEMRLEIADLFCFIINAALATGMSADDVNAIHAEKMGINHQRQNSGVY